MKKDGFIEIEKAPAIQTELEMSVHLLAFELDRDLAADIPTDRRLGVKTGIEAQTAGGRFQAADRRYPPGDRDHARAHGHLPEIDDEIAV